MARFELLPVGPRLRLRRWGGAATNDDEQREEEEDKGEKPEKPEPEPEPKMPFDAANATASFDSVSGASVAGTVDPDVAFEEKLKLLKQRYGKTEKKAEDAKPIRGVKKNRTAAKKHDFSQWVEIPAAEPANESDRAESELVPSAPPNSTVDVNPKNLKPSAPPLSTTTPIVSPPPSAPPMPTVTRMFGINDDEKDNDLNNPAVQSGENAIVWNDAADDDDKLTNPPLFQPPVSSSKPSAPSALPNGSAPPKGSALPTEEDHPNKPNAWLFQRLIRSEVKCTQPKNKDSHKAVYYYYFKEHPNMRTWLCVGDGDRIRDLQNAEGLKVEDVFDRRQLTTLGHQFRMPSGGWRAWFLSWVKSSQPDPLSDCLNFDRVLTWSPEQWARLMIAQAQMVTGVSVFPFVSMMQRWIEELNDACDAAEDIVNEDEHWKRREKTIQSAKRWFYRFRRADKGMSTESGKLLAVCTVLKDLIRCFQYEGAKPPVYENYSTNGVIPLVLHSSAMTSNFVVFVWILCYFAGVSDVHLDIDPHIDHDVFRYVLRIGQSYVVAQQKEGNVRVTVNRTLADKMNLAELANDLVLWPTSEYDKDPKDTSVAVGSAVLWPRLHSDQFPWRDLATTLDLHLLAAMSYTQPPFARDVMMRNWSRVMIRHTQPGRIYWVENNNESRWWTTYAKLMEKKDELKVDPKNPYKRSARALEIEQTCQYQEFEMILAAFTTAPEVTQVRMNYWIKNVKLVTLQALYTAYYKASDNVTLEAACRRWRSSVGPVRRAVADAMNQRYAELSDKENVAPTQRAPE